MSLGAYHAATTEYLSNHRIFEITGKQSTKKWLGGILKKKKKSWNGEQAQLKEIKLLVTDGIKRMIFPDKRWL